MSIELKQLILDNPELPIFAWVDSEIVCDDSYSRWMGEFGAARVAEVTSYDIYGEYRLIEKDDTSELFDYLYDQEENEEKTDAEIDSYIDALPWKKVILVNVDLPDSI